MFSHSSLSKYFPLFGLLGMGLVAACSDDSGSPTPVGSTGGTSSGGNSVTTGGAATGGAAAAVFVPPVDPGNNGFLVTVSGEDLALLGYEWASAALSAGDPPAFVDGWAVKFDHVIVTLHKIRLNSEPDKDAANPKNLGAVVASADGPWAVDASIGGNIPGKSGSADEKTVAITAFAKQAGGQAFDPKARYAFSYDVVEAKAGAQIVNLDAAGRALYDEGVQKGWAYIFTGTATYKGPAPEVGSVFAKMPTTVNFKLGMKNPTSYINCRNTDLTAVAGEFPRGIQSNANSSTTTQITIHTDHGFWNKLNVEGTPLHFDVFAANASTFGTPAMPGLVTMDDLVNVDITGFQTKAGDVLPARSLVSDYTAPAGQLRFDANGTSFTVANSFAGFFAYSVTSGGHMNADGECEVQNNYTP